MSDKNKKEHFKKS